MVEETQMKFVVVVKRGSRNSNSIETTITFSYVTFFAIPFISVISMHRLLSLITEGENFQCENKLK